MTDSVEVFVQNVVRDSHGNTIVVGIPNNRRSLKVGDVFTMRYEIAREDVMKQVSNPPRQNEHAISLKVSKIEVQGKQVGELDYKTGAYGGLHLEGTGLDLVAKRTLLRTRGD
jgi:hypothetical protein